MALIPHSRFCTDDLPERDREAAWHEDISVIFDHASAPVEDPFPFHACFDVYHFGHSALARLQASSGRYMRSTRKATTDGMDAILIQLFLEGGVQFGVGQRTTYAEAGDIIVFDLAQPVDNVNQRFHNITMGWPREMIEALVPRISSWHGHCLPKDDPSVALLRQHMVSSCDLAPQFTQAQGQRVEKATLALVGAALSGNELTPEQLEMPDMKALLVYQIKRYIRKHLSDTDQSPEQIARHFGISRRQLYQLLKSVGGIARYQMHLRLKRCMADLQNPDHARMQISEIAYRWGYRNLATFNRNFRSTFDTTASEVRNRQQQTPSPFAPLSPLTVKEGESIAQHQQWFISLGI